MREGAAIRATLELLTLSRLRYWLHLLQAPKYRTGFIASETFLLSLQSRPTTPLGSDVDALCGVYPYWRVGKGAIKKGNRMAPQPVALLAPPIPSAQVQNGFHRLRRTFRPSGCKGTRGAKATPCNTHHLRVSDTAWMRVVQVQCVRSDHGGGRSPVVVMHVTVATASLFTSCGLRGGSSKAEHAELVSRRRQAYGVVILRP